MLIESMPGRAFVKVFVHLRYVPTGAVRIMSTATLIEEGNDGTWYFTRGNASCDCNRAIDFLGQARDQSGAWEIEARETRCGYNMAYALDLIVRADNGAYLYRGEELPW